jgi:heme/copper-type cytochrome/quinol oxidase subunit 2
MAAALLLLIVGAGVLHGQSSEESVDTNQSTAAGDTATTSTNATPAPVTTSVPAWTHFVRIAAMGGPIAFLVLAWIVGFIVHYRLVYREQAQFPAIRGSRTPQTVPMFISAALFFVPALLFVIFEVRSRIEIRRGIGGVVDEWHPVTAHAWISLVICLVLALVPWLFARRADTVS